MVRIFPVVIILLIVFLFCIVVFLHVRKLDEYKEDQISKFFEDYENLKVYPGVPDYKHIMLMATIFLLFNIITCICKSFNISTPESVFVMMIGYLLGMAAFSRNYMFLALNFHKMISFDLYYVYIPVTVFNLSFGLDYQIFLKSFPQMLVIGIPVCFCTVFLFGPLSRLILKKDNEKWPKELGFKMGLYAVPIYPKKITKLLRNETYRTKHISVLLDTEALFTFIVVDMTRQIIEGVGDEPRFGIKSYLTKWHHYVCVMLRFLVLGVFSGFLFGFLGRYLMRKMYTNRLSVFLICFLIPFLTYGISQEVISGCGSVAVMVLGVMMSEERTVLSKDTESILVHFWESAGTMLNLVVITKCVMGYACMMAPSIKTEHYAILFVVFFLYYAVRFISFLIFSPILSRVGYGMDLKSMLVCVWSGIKSPYSLEVVRHVRRFTVEDDDIENTIFFHIMALYFLSLLINATIAPGLASFLGLRQISLARQVNMNKCMKHIFAKREKTIAVLKVDRFLADANWMMVVEATDIKHPYQTKIDTTEEDEFLLGYRFTYCGDCKKDIPQTPTVKEVKEMTREAKMRILKAKQTSYSRQYENGMISNEGIRIMSQAIELAMDSEDCVIKVADLVKQFAEERWFQRTIRSRAEKLELKQKNATKPPNTYWRRLCYNQIIKSHTFDKVMLAVVAVHCILLAVEISYFTQKCSNTTNTTNTLNTLPLDQKGFHYTFAVLKPILCILYMSEFIMRILAYSRVHICQDGFRTYFTNIWYIIDFLALIGTIMKMIDSYIVIQQKTIKCINWEKDVFRVVIFILAWMRFVRIVRILDIFYPDVIEYLNRAVDNKMAFTYELGKSYTSAETEVLDKLPYMIDNKTIRDNMKVLIESDRILITKLLGTVQKERPWIAITVKTKQAIRTILCGMNDAMYSLKTSGWIDTYEYQKLQNALGALYKNVGSIKKINPSPPKVIFKEVSWMSDDEVVIDFLFENVTVKTFLPGDIVFKEGDVADGIYIVVTGLFLLTYKPAQNILNSLHLYGQLPIVDYLSGTKFEEEAVDYIVSGNCIGELSTLTERAYNCVITAETHSQVYVLSRGVLNRAMELSPDPITGLECRIWKEVSQRKALPLLLSVPAYQDLSQDQIKYALERAFVPNLSNYKIFAVTDMIEEIVVIEGVAADYNTSESFIAPCCIPRNVQKLILPTSSLMNIPIHIETKLMIIPEKEVDEYDVMLAAEETCEMVNTGSAYKCLQHTIQDRVKKKNRKRALRERRGRTGTSDFSVGTSAGTSAGSSVSGVTFGSSSSPISFKNKDGETTSVNIEEEEEEIEKEGVNYDESTSTPPPPLLNIPARRKQSLFYM